MMSVLRWIIAGLGIAATAAGIGGVGIVAMRIDDQWGSFAENRALMIGSFILAVLCFIAVNMRPPTTIAPTGNVDGER